MIVVAVFFDILQWALVFILMGWLAGLFAFLTFYVWFKSYGISFMKPKKALALFGGGLIEVIPVLSALPAWTVAVLIITFDSKIKKTLPVDISKGKGAVVPFTPKSQNSSTPMDKKAA
jgi:hypothetical protein